MDDKPTRAVGRGRLATADMKARIAALRAQGADVVDALWERNYRAILGEGFRYECAEEGTEFLRSAGEQS